MKKLVISLVGAVLLGTAVCAAQSALGNALGKIGGAIEKRYKQQVERERQVENSKIRTTYDAESWNNVCAGVCYDCDLYTGSFPCATVTNGVQGYTRYSYEDLEAGKDVSSGSINNHAALQSIHIPDYVYHNERDSKGRVIKSGNCKVTAMEDDAFYKTSATSAWITGNISRIPRYAFARSRLRGLTLNYGIEYIGESAFRSCTDLGAITLPASVKQIHDRAFVFCLSLRELNVPESVEYLGAYCFANCYNLGKLRLPSKLYSLSEGLVAGCTNLYILNIPPGCKRMYDNVFARPKVGSHSYDMDISSTSIISMICVYSDMPPVCSENTFYGVDFNRCSLYVPEHLIDTYRNTYGWNRFERVYSLESLPKPEYDFTSYSQVNYEIVGEDAPSEDNEPVVIQFKATRTTTTTRTY